MTELVRTSTRVDRYWRAVPAVACTTAVVAAIAAVALSLEWLPATPSGEAGEPSPGATTAATWADVHIVAVVATILLCLLGFVTAIRTVIVRRRRVGTRALFIAVVTGIGMVIVRPLVFWEELTLRRPRLDSAWQGMWQVAFSDQLEIVVVDAEVVDQGAYRMAMIAHTLVLPTFLVLATAVAAWNLSRS